MCFVEPALAEPFEHRDRVALVREVELVVGEEDRHAPDAALARPGDGALDLVEHGVEIAVRVLTAEVRRGAVDALHRAADARPDRKRVRGRVERIAARRPAEAEVVRTDPVGLSPPDQPRDLVPGRVRTEHGQRVLAGADDAVVDVEELEAFLRAGREARPARDEHRLRRRLAQGSPQLADLGEQEADVDRLVVGRVEPVDHDAVVDDPDPEPDQVGPESPRGLAGRSERVLGDEVWVEELQPRRRSSSAAVRSRSSPYAGTGVTRWNGFA